MAEDQRLTPGAGSLFIAASDRIDDTKAVFRNSIWGFDGANWNRAIVDASGTLKTTAGGGGGGGTVDQGVGGTDPWLIEGEVTIGGQPIAVTGPLTDAELRATPVDVLGPLTDIELRATPVPISGTVAVSSVGGTVTISGTVTADTELTVRDYDTSGGTDNVAVVGILLPSASGAVAGGTATNPVRTDPTGTTAQPITDNAGSLTVDQATAANLNATVVGTGTFQVQVSNTPTVDTELETAAALADGQSNPTISRVGAVRLQAKYVDGTLTFDRRPHSYYQNRTGAGTASGAGTTVDMTMGPCSKYAMYVENGTGTTSAWNINLEGSYDGSAWIILGNNTSLTGAAQALWVTERPARFMRSNVISVTGGGTVRIRILATQN